MLINDCCRRDVKNHLRVLPIPIESIVDEKGDRIFETGEYIHVDETSQT